jgi:histidinol dehydrogenase
MNISILPERSTWSALCRRPTSSVDILRSDVITILDAVRAGGDEAVADLTYRYDGVRPQHAVVPTSVLDEAVAGLDPAVRRAINTASDTIRRFHAAQVRPPVVVETRPGVECRLESRPLSSVGIYVPGGTAPLVSTVLMLAIPARLAGVRTVVLATPPGADGLPDRTVLAAAHLCGVDTVYVAGGAQAIGALAFGTASIPAVRLIAGPGNAWVTTAKQLVQEYGIGIDMPAGPSEVLVLADDAARPDYIAADLLAQAEHGVDSQVMLVTTSHELVQRVLHALEHQIADLPRASIARRALSDSRALVVPTMEDAVAFAEMYAPEHLIIMAQDDEDLCARIGTAGSVFLGNSTPESLGDYASGTNHTLPTGGWAAVVGGVRLDTFQRTVTVQRATPAGLEQLADAVVTLARAEGLEAHARAVLIRAPASGAIPVVTTVLDANENPCGVLGESVSRYPDPAKRNLVTAIASYAGVEPENIVVGNGSDELIDLIVRSTCASGRSSVVIPEPTFVMFGHAARTHGVNVISVPPSVGRWWDVDNVLAAVRPDTSLIMLCSPNNPVGYAIPEGDVRRLLAATTATVLLDEAYVEFGDVPSMLGQAAEIDRLIVLRTFSKAWGLASMRLGWACASPRIVAEICGLQAPYTVNEWASQTVQWALRTQERTMKRSVASVVRRRSVLADQLSDLPCVEAVEPSQGNFLLVRFGPIERVRKALNEAHIRVRDRTSEPGCERCLRISIGTTAEIERLLTVLRSVE